MKTCDQVAERVALGESLGDLADHAAECPHCKRLIALPVELSMMKRDADPGMGFASRMTAGAQHRITARRHQRLRGDVPAHDVVVDVVQLVGDEVTVGELVDAQRRDDVGQRQGSEDHLGIMPQRRSPVVAALSARAARPCWR